MSENNQNEKIGDKFEHSKRLYTFFSFILAQAELEAEETGPIPDDRVFLYFMGSGASDSITYKHINDFMNEVKRNCDD
jgi:hypothetical protein